VTFKSAHVNYSATLNLNKTTCHPSTMPRKRKSLPRPPRTQKPIVLANNAAPFIGPLQKPKTKRRSRRGNRKSKGFTSHHIRGVCVITDPFCPAAKNSKWPDGTSGNTLTQQFRGHVSLNTSLATGQFYYAFVPHAPYGYITGTVAAGSVTLAASYTILQASSMLATYGQAFRVVSAGCIIRCTASATNASGIVTLGTSTAPQPTAVIALGGELYQDTTVKALQPGMELSWISMPIGSTAREFSTLGTANPGPTSVDWTCLSIEMSGGPGSATTMADLEWFVNVEFTINAGSGLATLAKPNPPAITKATEAASAVHSTLGSFIEGGVRTVEDTVYKHVSDALTNLMADPLESISMLFA